MQNWCGLCRYIQASLHSCVPTEVSHPFSEFILVGIAFILPPYCLWTVRTATDMCKRIYSTLLPYRCLLQGDRLKVLSLFQIPIFFSPGLLVLRLFLFFQCSYFEYTCLHHWNGRGSRDGREEGGREGRASNVLSLLSSSPLIHDQYLLPSSDIFLSSFWLGISAEI